VTSPLKRAALTSSVVYDLLVRSSGWSNAAYESGWPLGS
jgi:hypothetical protein